MYNIQFIFLSPHRTLPPKHRRSSQLVVCPSDQRLGQVLTSEHQQPPEGTGSTAADETWQAENCHEYVSRKGWRNFQIDFEKVSGYCLHCATSRVLAYFHSYFNY